MEFPQERKTTEEQISLVETWVNKFSETGEVGYIDKTDLREVLEHFGANFYDNGSKERLEQLSCLAAYSNAKKAPGMSAVWGEERIRVKGEFNKWCEEWAKEYTEKTGKKLPKIIQKGKEYFKSGMVAFFGEITAYAAGRMEFTLLKTRLEARYKNGRIYQEEQRIDGIEDKYAKVTMVDVYEKDGKTVVEVKEIRPSSFPPGFPEAAWKEIKSWK